MDSTREFGRADERGEGSAMTVMDALAPTGVQALSAAVVSNIMSVSERVYIAGYCTWSNLLKGAILEH
jgi:hypothetical protein